MVCISNLKLTQLTIDSKRYKRQSFTSLKKAITYYKEIESQLLSNKNRLNQWNELRKSIQSIGSRNINNVDRLNRSRSSFEVCNGKIKYNNEDKSIYAKQQSFIIQPGKEVFMQRRNSGFQNDLINQKESEKIISGEHALKSIRMVISSLFNRI